MDTNDALRRVFRDAPFIAHLGIELVDIGAGWCEATMKLLEWHRLHCRAEVLKPGRRLAVVESLVWAEPETGKRELVAKLNATMAVLRAA